MSEEQAWNEALLNEPEAGTATATEPETAATHRARHGTNGRSMPSLVIGIAVVAVAVSGLLDDSGALTHPYWVVPAAAFFACCAAIATRSVRGLLTAGGVR